jgi:hypothetical protein
MNLISTHVKINLKKPISMINFFDTFSFVLKSEVFISEQIFRERRHLMITTTHNFT